MEIKTYEDSDGHEVVEISGESEEILNALGSFPSCLKFVQKDGGWTYKSGPVNVDDRVCGSAGRKKKRKKWKRVKRRLDYFKIRKRTDLGGPDSYTAFVSKGPSGRSKYKTSIREQQIKGRLSKLNSAELKKEILKLVE